MVKKLQILTTTKVFSAAVLLGLAGMLQTAAADLPDFTGLVEEASPSVVNITTSTFGRDRQRSEQELPELFRRFFDTPYEEDDDSQQRRFRQERRSGGSGFIVDPNGYIITNHHVVDGAEEILVQLADRREYEATLVGSDAQSDIALLKIDGDRFPALEMGSSEDLKLGEWVIAIGSPFGFEQSVTAGIVSAKGRSNNSQQYVPFIQTDVPINRGNSGGPLLNMKGEVVGVNSWILSSNGGFIGLSFSIPIEVASNSASQLRQFGRVSRGLLGVNIEPVNRDLAKVLNLDRPRGALVNRVEPKSAADKAGVQVGDVILAFNGKSIEEFSDLPPLVGALRPGTSADLVISRDGRQRVLQTRIGERQEENVVPASLEADDGGFSNSLGVIVEPIPDTLREQFDDLDGGVVVREVESEAAWRAGVRPGDVVVRLNRKRIESVRDFRDFADSVKTGETIAVLLLQRGVPNFIAYTVEAETEEG